MYIAQKKIKGRVHYVLRESCPDSRPNSFRDLFELGLDPSKYIVYPGGNSYYIDESIEEELTASGALFDPDALEELFWPFLEPDIRRAVEPFRNRSQRRGPRRRLSAGEEEAIHAALHPFDKRRFCFLRFGDMDPEPMTRMPLSLFKRFVGKARDEIEQLFIEMEMSLKTHERKSYVYVSFNLQRFFSGFFAKKMPHVLDQEKIDAFFLEEICRVNQSLFSDADAQADMPLHDYLSRYVIMFFDNEYQGSTLLDNFSRDFIYRHHFFRPPPPKKSISTSKAARIFGFEKDNLAAVTKRELTKRYRKLAQKVHPDKGGSEKKFVALNDAYESLLDKISST